MPFGPEESRFRKLGRPVFALVTIVSVLVSLLHLYLNTLGTLSHLWQNVIHYAGFAFLCALVYPASSRCRSSVCVALDGVFGFLVLLSALYVALAEDAIYARGMSLSALDWLAGSVLIVSAVELTRRTTGWVIPVLIIVALSYVAFWGAYVPGVFSFAGLSGETLLFRSIYGDDGLFGSIASISSSYVMMFILFGAFLLRSGAGDFIIRIAQFIAGRLLGGPGLVAVTASALTGTISGSAVANTASTGVITIPMMKKAGFDARFAAGVEAAASTGGQLMPPVMGAGAFVMASYTQIPYSTIVAVSLIPALLYFLSIVFFIRIEAQRRPLHPAGDERITLPQLLREGGVSFFLPIGVLITLLVMGFTPTYAAGVGILAVIASTWLTPRKMGLRAIREALALGAQNMITTAVLLCAVGLVVNVIATAGVGNTFSLMITQWAAHSLLLAIVLLALASLILGMGLPVTAAYIVLGTLSAPALYQLITDTQVVQALAAGQLSAEVKAMFLLFSPEAGPQLNAPMSMSAARELFHALPYELSGQVREALLSPVQLSMALLTAHMIIFWLSQDSNVTPPVCLTAFTAATIAGTPPMATGLQAWKIAKGLYIMPLLFAFTPMIGGQWNEVITVALFCAFGLYAFSAALQGFLVTSLSWLWRCALLLIGLVLVWPGGVWPKLVAVLVLIASVAARRKLSPG